MRTTTTTSNTSSNKMQTRLSHIFQWQHGSNGGILDTESQYGRRGSTARFARLRSAFLRVLLPLTLLICASNYILASLFHSSSIPLIGGSGSNGERTISSSQLQSLSPPVRSDPGGPRRLRLFMPADGPNINLCKTIMSAVALGYPMPTLINWNGEFNRPDWHFAGSHIAKLESLLAVIDTLREQGDEDVKDNDLVLLVDAYDIWFQLPPAVLIERFHRLNRAADARVAQQWEQHGFKPDFPIQPPKQNVIVTTAKDCQPDWESGSNPRYEYWPDSPLPRDFYGEGTDTVLPYLFDSARKYKKIRPRCVNSGMIMGTVASLRGALRRCREKVDAAAMNGRQLWSDQALFAEVIGDQEVWRHWARGLASTWNGTASHDRPRDLPREVRDIAAEALLSGRGFEFGIGLDYDFATIPPTCSSEDDGYFVKLDDADAVRAESEKAGVPDGVRVHGVPAELRNDEDAAVVVQPPLPGVGWGAVPLYTDFFFGTAPVGIHHNAYVFGLKRLRLENWWNLTWYYPHLRELVGKALQSGGSSSRKLTPLARLPLDGDSSNEGEGDGGNNEMVYWGSGEDEAEGKRRPRVFDASGKEGNKFASIEWDGVCQKGEKKWYDVLFGDDKGPLDV